MHFDWQIEGVTQSVFVRSLPVIREKKDLVLQALKIMQKNFIKNTKKQKSNKVSFNYVAWKIVNPSWESKRKIMIWTDQKDTKENYNNWAGNLTRVITKAKQVTSYGCQSIYLHRKEVTEVSRGRKRRMRQWGDICCHRSGSVEREIIRIAQSQAAMLHWIEPWGPQEMQLQSKRKAALLNHDW